MSFLVIRYFAKAGRHGCISHDLSSEVKSHLCFWRILTMQKFIEADYYELDWYYEECTDGKYLFLVSCCRIWSLWDCGPSLFNGFKNVVPWKRQHPGVTEMPASLLHLSLSCELATRDCCRAFSFPEGVAEEPVHYMSNIRTGGEMLEMLNVCVIIQLNLNTLTVGFCVGLSLSLCVFLCITNML